MSLIPTPSELRVTVLSLDSRFADQTYGTSADYMVRLPSLMRNVAKIALTSIEIPQVVYVFSGVPTGCTPGNGNINFTVTIGTVESPFDISAGNYEPSELAIMMTATLGLGIGTCLYNPQSNRFSIRNDGTQILTIDLASSDVTIASRVKFWGLGYNLGFTAQTYDIPAGATIVAESSPTVHLPSYMLLQMQCPDNAENTIHRLADGSYLPVFAKIVLRPGYSGHGHYQVQYDDAGSDLRKELIFMKPTAVTQIRLRLLDAYGATVGLGPTDWSVTLEVTEVVSACKYNALNRAMPVNC